MSWNWLAVQFAVLFFCHVLSGRAVSVMSHNTTAVLYIKWQGGMVSPSLCKVALVLWKDCIVMKVYLWAVHVPRIQNVEQTQQGGSVATRVGTESYISTTPFPALGDSGHRCFLWTTSVWNAIFSAADMAATQNCWGMVFFYGEWKFVHLFPTFFLLGERVITKLQEERPYAILIAPWWPCQVWFLMLNSLAQGCCFQFLAVVELFRP